MRGPPPHHDAALAVLVQDIPQRLGPAAEIGDRLNGEAGDEIVNGGPGADQLSCGPGNDIVLSDAADTVAADCL